MSRPREAGPRDAARQRSAVCPRHASRRFESELRCCRSRSFARRCAITARLSRDRSRLREIPLSSSSFPQAASTERQGPMRQTRFVVTMTLFAWLADVPAGWAQQASGIAGLVRDTSGAVLPGVTVEAASPVLIEKVRSAVTDGQGRFNIVDLRPGTYTVTFALPGFNTLRREGIQLTAGFTATINADLQVGALEETVTVTGQSPLVDVQNVKQQK